MDTGYVARMAVAEFYQGIGDTADIGEPRNHDDQPYWHSRHEDACSRELAY